MTREMVMELLDLAEDDELMILFDEQHATGLSWMAIAKGQLMTMNAIIKYYTNERRN